MARVVVLTDSDACLPADLARQLDIAIVPHGLIIDGQVYRDGDLTSAQFYSLLRAARRLPSTASPPPGAFLDAFKDAAQRAEAALCITLSSKYSGTYNAALDAANRTKEELPGFSVRVLDSHSLAMCHGFVVMAAARAAAAGADLAAAAVAAEEVRQRAQLIGALDTLRYLAKSGRVPWAVHWATALLQIKPILLAQQDEVKALERVRTRQRALERLLYHLQQRVQGDEPLHVAVMHADAEADAQALAERIQQELRPAELVLTEFTSVMGIHTGPGLIAVAFYSDGPLPQETGTQAEGQGDELKASLEADVRRIEASLQPLPPPQPRPALVVVSGLPGSGKSHFSRQLGQRFPLARLESDALRKALFPTPTYSSQESARLFAACHQVLDRLLAQGIPAVLDATNLREIHRRQLYRIAEKHGAKVVLVSLKAPPWLVRRRLKARQLRANPWDYSDADIAVYERLRGQAEPIQGPHIVVDTSGDIEPGLQAVLRELTALEERARP